MQTFFVGLLCVVLIAAIAGSFEHWRANRPDADWALRDEHESMRQALLFYADLSHWRRRHFHGRHWTNSAAAADRGARARTLLDRMGEGGDAA